MLRSLIAGVIAAAVAAPAVWYVSYVPVRCNTTRQVVLAKTMAAEKLDHYEAAVAGRENLGRLAFCRMHSLYDYGIPLLAGRNYHVMGDYDSAIAELERALRIDVRPELYALIGKSMEAAGRFDDAVAPYTRAAMFDRNVLTMIASPVVAEEVRKAVDGSGSEDQRSASRAPVKRTFP